jgi:ribosome production factor 1
MEVNAKLKKQKKKEKKKAQEKRKREEEELGENAPPKKIPRTLENTREVDETIVDLADEEVIQDEAEDEFSNYFDGKVTPKILITTSTRPSHRLKDFVNDLLTVFPNSYYRPRRNHRLKTIIHVSKRQRFTDIIVINEDQKTPNGMLLCHLPRGPTALFKLTSLKLIKEIPGHGKATAHRPELILNNFNTRLGHTIGRMFAALFPLVPQFTGRRVVTFHNQRDFIFFRHHRYIFESAKKARLQELGPRFTLKLRYLQHGTFDSKNGEYEWIQKKEKVTSRRRFFL